MVRIATPARRSYQSDLRAEQAEATRTRILDATLRVMARGLASVSIPAVAAEAGVSVPTVYRHFGTKHDLLTALYPHGMRQAGAELPAIPRSLDDLRDGVRALFGGVDSMDDLARAALASPAAEEARKATMPRRLAVMRQLADAFAPDLGAAERARIARLLTVLMNSSALRVWRDHLGSSVDEAADDVDWFVRAAIAASKAKSQR